MNDQPLTSERLEQYRRAAWEHGYVHPGELLAEIDRLRADLATAREALEKIARDRVTRSGRDARGALDRIGEQEWQYTEEPTHGVCETCGRAR